MEFLIFKKIVFSYRKLHNLIKAIIYFETHEFLFTVFLRPIRFHCFLYKVKSQNITFNQKIFSE